MWERSAKKFIPSPLPGLSKSRKNKILHHCQPLTLPHGSAKNVSEKGDSTVGREIRSQKFLDFIEISNHPLYVSFTGMWLVCTEIVTTKPPIKEYAEIGVISKSKGDFHLYPYGYKNLSQNISFIL